jgi:membrane protein required for colicin V production
MAGLDWFVLLTILISIVIGMWRGFIREAFAIAAWIAGAFCAWQYAEFAAGLLGNLPSQPPLRMIAGYVLAFLAAYIVVAIIGAIVRSILNAVGLSFLDRGLGAVFGIARAAIVIIIVASLAANTPLAQSKEWTEALVAAPLAVALAAAKPFIPQNLGKSLPTPKSAQRTQRSNFGAFA